MVRAVVVVPVGVPPSTSRGCEAVGGRHLRRGQHGQPLLRRRPRPQRKQPRKSALSFARPRLHNKSTRRLPFPHKWFVYSLKKVSHRPRRRRRPVSSCSSPGQRRAPPRPGRSTRRAGRTRTGGSGAGDRDRRRTFCCCLISCATTIAVRRTANV